jgi:hypothetical protein
MIFVLQRLCFYCPAQGSQDQLAFFSEKFAKLFETWREGGVATISES